MRARLADGDRILEPGCGWGSLSLWMADPYPNSTVRAVSNSRTQRHFIEARAHLFTHAAYACPFEVRNASDWMARHFFGGGIMPSDICSCTCSATVYWRVFFMACAKLWGFRGGREWLVSHYLFGAAPGSGPAT